MINDVLKILLLLWIPAQGAVAAEIDAVRLAVSGEHRPQANRDRDVYRHPEQTLKFFGVTESMTVVEIWPGGEGWYTEILAPLLRDRGRLYAAQFSERSQVPYFRESLAKFNKKIESRPDIYGKVMVTVLQPPEELEIAPEGSADAVLTFRNVHNWMKNGQAEAVFKAMHRALKPGGILGVVEHRRRGGEQDPQALSGYVTEDYVIGLAENVGFELLEKSEINANPKDEGNHPAGVWTLPPTLRLKEQDRDKYLAIGESDRMTLKFVKP
ncbi:MAG: class I SAM-dependent methyltransferase [Gammaproteobacteria bacterium]